MSRTLVLEFQQAHRESVEGGELEHSQQGPEHRGTIVGLVDLGQCSNSRQTAGMWIGLIVKLCNQISNYIYIVCMRKL